MAQNQSTVSMPEAWLWKTNCKSQVSQSKLVRGVTLDQLCSTSLKRVETETQTEALMQHSGQFSSAPTNFWTLWVQYQDYLYQRCLSWMNCNPTEAQEAVSRASIKAWEKWQDYAGKVTNPRAWLTRLTHNLCMDMHRERSREASRIESLENLSVAGNDHVTCSLPSPESEVLHCERDMYIRGAIDALPANVRIPFILRYYQEMSYSDIAQQLAISNDNARKRVQQARTILQKQLNKYFSGLDDSSFSATDLNPPLKRGVMSQESSESDFSLGTRQFCHKAMKPVLEKVVSEQITASGCKTPIAARCTPESIDYKVTATCLEALSHTWYSSPSCLRWR